MNSKGPEKRISPLPAPPQKKAVEETRYVSLRENLQ